MKLKNYEVLESNLLKKNRKYKKKEKINYNSENKFIERKIGETFLLNKLFFIDN